jgi:PTS system ascorbate-specific IIA component
MLAAARHVYSRDPCSASRRMSSLDVAPGTDPEALLRKARELVDQVDQGQGVLVLTDLVGATPGNVAARLAEPGRVEVVSGANMPMLLRSLCYGEQTLGELVQKAVAGGTTGVQRIDTTPTEKEPPQAR